RMRSHLASLAALVGLVGVCCHSAPPPETTSRITEPCATADPAPTLSFDLGDGRHLRAWKYHQDWSELDPSDFWLIQVVRDSDGTFRFLLGSLSYRPLSYEEADELLAPETSLGRRRELADRIA